MKVSAFIRKSASKNDTDSVATIYFRLRDGSKDIKAASELSINPNHWSAEKQGYKDRVALVAEEDKLKLNNDVRNIVSIITKTYYISIAEGWEGGNDNQEDRVKKNQILAYGFSQE